MQININKINLNYKKYLDLIKESKDPKICIVGSLHGQEKVGTKIINELSNLKIKKGTLITIIGNYKALKLNKRFIDQDLNRSFPGKIDGNFEEEVAYKLNQIIKECDIVLDIHSTTTDTKSLAIVTKMNDKILKILKILNPESVVLMDLPMKEKAMISNCKIGISMEYGRDNNKETQDKIFNGILKILIYFKMIDEVVDNKSLYQFKNNFYKVRDVIINKNNLIADKKIKNLKLVKKGTIIARNDVKLIRAEEDFYPIIFGEKSYTDILGFKGFKERLE